MVKEQDQTKQTTEASESKPVIKQTTKKTVVAKKQRYFVPELGRQVEARNLNEVAEIVKKETKG